MMMGKQHQTPLRLLLVTYEFTYSSFSGNGILARSLVKSLLGHGCQVTVWCCRPPLINGQRNNDQEDNDDGTNGDSVFKAAKQEGRLKIFAVTITDHRQWNRVDDASAWNEFTWKNLSQSSRDTLTRDILPFIDAVSVIDWTGFHAWDSVPVTETLPAAPLQPTPLVHLNFRVFSSGVTDDQKREWYNAMERRVLRNASAVIVLSQNDKDSLNDISPPKECVHRSDEIAIVPPPLRGDVEELAKQWLQASTEEQKQQIRSQLPYQLMKALSQRRGIDSTSRCFITCVVRLSPEKNTMGFSLSGSGARALGC